MVSKAMIQKAVELLKEGKLVVIPTETVYGLAADASNPKAIAKIFKVKNRPTKHPMIVHIPSADYLKEWAIDIPDIAYELAEAFWPGPLTMVLKKAPHVSKVITGGQDTIALRCPSHPVTQAILKEFKGGLAAPSANSFGHISPTCVDHVKNDLGDKVDLIVDGGPCSVGIESTIIDLTSEFPSILRPGMISAKEISIVLKKPITCCLDPNLAKTKFTDKPIQKSPRVSGSLPKHYAPKTPAALVPCCTVFVTLLKDQLKKNNIVVLAHHTKEQKLPESDKRLIWIELPKSAKAYAKEIYQRLHEADDYHFDLIIIEDVPERPEWFPIKDRLKRAATKKIV